MKLNFPCVTIAGALFLSSATFAQAPVAAPAGSTGLCKDGSYTNNDTKKGSCSGHKGVKDWFGGAATPATVATKPATETSAPAAATSKGLPDASAPATGKAQSITAAAGGGAGKVWVNTGTKVYHCSGTKFYGKTKQGEYMTEATAKTAGAHADHGKACS